MMTMRRIGSLRESSLLFLRSKGVMITAYIPLLTLNHFLFRHSAAESYGTPYRISAHQERSARIGELCLVQP